MVNPYAPPSPVAEVAPRPIRRFVSPLLFAFGTTLTLPELYANSADLTQNPIGNIMGLAIIVTTAIIACTDWFYESSLIRFVRPSLSVLAVIASLVIVRFVTNFLPVLTTSWAREHVGVLLGFIFSLSAIAHILARRLLESPAQNRGRLTPTRR